MSPDRTHIIVKPSPEYRWIGAVCYGDGNVFIPSYAWHAIEYDENGWPMVKKIGTPLKGTRLGDAFKLSIDGRVMRDEAKAESKLDVSTRLQRKKSKRVRVKRPVDDFRV